MNQPKLPVNAYILTGGQSRRFKSDKSLVKLGNKTVTEILYDRLKSIFQNVFVVGKKVPPIDLPFISDLNHIQCPLNGIVTALEHSTTKWSFVIACDQPLLQKETIISLYNHVSPGFHIVIPETDNKLHTTCAFYHQHTLPVFVGALSRGEYVIFKPFDVLNVKKVVIKNSTVEQFININTLEDLKMAEKFFLEIGEK